MIKSFKSRESEKIFHREFSKKLPQDIQRRGLIKLRMLNRAKNLGDLKVPPNNKLEALHGDRDRQYSIRINKQWRICFVWDGNDANNVEITDYH